MRYYVIFLLIFCLFWDAKADENRPLFAVCSSGLIWDQPPVLPPREPWQHDIPYLSYKASRLAPYDPTLACSAVTVQPYGFVKWEAFFDTRQIIGLDEGMGLLFPSPRVLDTFCQDINAHGFWNMTAFETRWGALLTGPDWGRFATDGLIEADFRGSFETGIFNFRLRNVFGRVLWENGFFLYGLWWHPLWIPECFPHTLGFAVGAPCDPQARDPQLRLSQKWDWFELTVAALSQSFYASPGPKGATPLYIEQAVIPNLHLQMRAYFDNNVIGIAGDYKRLVPRLVTDKCVKVHEFNDSFIVEAFGAFNYAPWSLRCKTFWAQNGADQLLISGYGVRTVDHCTGARTYSNTAAVGGWVDFSYLFHCDEMEVGLFVGGTKNIGSHDPLYIDPKTGRPIIYALRCVSQDIDYVVEVTPWFVFMKDPVRVGLELRYSRASWGKPDRFGRVTCGTPVDDFRTLFVLYYMF